MKGSAKPARSADRAEAGLSVAGRKAVATRHVQAAALSWGSFTRSVVVTVVVGTAHPSSSPAVSRWHPSPARRIAGGIEGSDAEERCEPAVWKEREPAVWKEPEPVVWKEPMMDERRSTDKGGAPNQPPTPEAATTANQRC